MGETYYDVLGVSADATPEEITAAYRERVLETHPDRSDDPDAVERFKAVTAAEDVLSDETERARYDRLGHDAYVRMADRFAPSTSSSRSSGSASSGSSGTGPGSGSSSDFDSASDSADESHSSTRSSATDGRASTSSRTASSDGSSGFGFDPAASAGAYAEGSQSRTRARARARSRSAADARDGPGHHARQRARRQRAHANARGGFGGTATKGRRSTGETGRGSETDSNSDSGSGTRVEDDTEQTGDGTTFRYAVHDWTDDVDLADERRPLDHSTLVTVCCVALVYPLLVYSSLSPQFSVVVNAVVAACTLVLVGYLLTMPRVAMAAFGGWSALVPFVLPRVTGIDPLSLVGLAVVGAFWVPFGYAIAVWWVLRP